MGARRLGSRLVVVVCVMCGVWLTAASAAFAAGAPVIDGESVAHVGTESASVSAQINPAEVATTYHFEYGSSEAYGSRMPLSSEAPVGSGGEDVTVSQPLSGLTPGTVYHYRVVASNAEGTTHGTDMTMKTYSLPSASETCPNAGIRETQFSTYLPDCRAYEMVSPAEKEGSNVESIPDGGTRSAPDGSAIKFDTSVGFGEVQGVEGLGFEYVSVRGADSWETHAINPKQASIPIGVFATAQYQGFSEDLSKGVFFGYTPVLPGHPNVEHASNLYLRSDVLTAGGGSYELLTDSVSPVPAQSPVPGGEEGTVAYADASADFSHVLFQSDDDLTPGAEGLSSELPKLYEWVNGTERLAGILPDGKPAEGSVAGRGAGGPNNEKHNWSLNTISADGSRVIFTAAPFVRGSNGGSIAFEGNLYMRIDGRETIQLNVSERSTPDPSGPQPAEFVAATPDDSKVLFITNGLLTDNAAGERNLYMYDMNASPGKHVRLISVDEEPGDNGAHAVALISNGLSEDGSYVYFLGQNMLVSGQPHIEDNEEYELYVWHNGLVRPLVRHQTHFINSGGGRAVIWGETGPYSGYSEARVTSDGRHAIFVTKSQVELDSASELAGIQAPRPLHEEVFLYSYETNKLECASCNPSGAGPEGVTQLYRKEDLSGANTFITGGTDYLTRAMSDDGRYVFFQTENALVPQDTNGWNDVYEYDAVTGEVRLISAGTCGCNSTFVDASADGSSVFFTTHQKLVRADIDTSADMYVARVDGGIQSQNEPPPAPCEGDDCQGPAKLAPVFSLPASATFAGVGNTPPSAGGLATPRARPLTSAQKLARALRACRGKPKPERMVCEAKARRAYRARRASRARAHRSRRAGL
jgi:hypothetical protein